MPEFRYLAVGAGGEMLRGVMDAPNEAAVVERLQRQGSMALRADPAKAGFLAGLLHLEFGRGQALHRQEVTDLTRELAIMLEAGQDLDRALHFLVETSTARRVRAVMQQIRTTVRDGNSFAAALAQHPRSFPRLYVGLVRAGEAGGTLGPTLDRLASLLENQRRLSATVTSALVYPALLVMAAIGSIVLMLTQVLPQFVPLFAENGANLPASTQFLIDAGAFLSQYGLLLLATIAGWVLAVRVGLRRPAIRQRADAWVLRVPVVGGLMREVLAARFARTIGTLLINGVGLIAALGIAREVLGNMAAIQALDRATVSAKGGAGLSGPLGQAAIFPARLIHLLRLGEENAQLGAMALRAADIHEDRTRIGVQRLMALLVPAITILMGAAIAGIVASLMMAMLSLNDLAGS